MQSLHDGDLTVLAEFQYAGFAMPVVIHFPEPGIDCCMKTLKTTQFTTPNCIERRLLALVFSVLAGCAADFDEMKLIVDGVGKDRLQDWCVDQLQHASYVANEDFKTIEKVPDWYKRDFRSPRLPYLVRRCRADKYDCVMFVIRAGHTKALIYVGDPSFSPNHENIEDFRELYPGIWANYEP